MLIAFKIRTLFIWTDPSLPDLMYLLITGPPRQPRMPRIGPCQVLAATLTLSQPGGADYAHPILESLAG